ncbi:MAG: hypothetical protein J0I12_33510 [Candidatus Eremiobacteraeota bacterium]|nr:hypothetical protein [Candidatus Eremiobacteraeota bacterium]
MNFELFKQMSKRNEFLAQNGQLDITVDEKVQQNGPKPMRVKIMELRNGVEKAVAYGEVGDDLLIYCERMLDGIWRVADQLSALGDSPVIAESAKTYVEIAGALDLLIGQLEAGGAAFASATLDLIDDHAQRVDQLLEECQAAA